MGDGVSAPDSVFGNNMHSRNGYLKIGMPEKRENEYSNSKK